MMNFYIIRYDSGSKNTTAKFLTRAVRIKVALNAKVVNYFRKETQLLNQNIRSQTDLSRLKSKNTV